MKFMRKKKTEAAENSKYGANKHKSSAASELMINKSRKTGLLVGYAFLSFIVLQNVLYFIAQTFGVIDKYSSSPLFADAFDTVLIIISLLLPYYLLSDKINKVSQVKQPLNFNTPKSSVEFILAVAAGVGLCMLTSIATSYFIAFLQLFGITLTSPEISYPEGVSGFIVTFTRVVVCAAMTEEITMRGYVMGNLRLYGEKYAILVSAVLFAVMHGNLVQAPFAFVSGLIIGYLTVKTDSMWTGILIHAFNNLISVIISYVSLYVSQETANLFSLIVIYAVIIIGIIAFSLFFIRTKDRKLKEALYEVALGSQVKAFLLNVPMLLCFIYMCYISSFYIKIG